MASCVKEGKVSVPEEVCDDVHQTHRQQSQNEMQYTEDEEATKERHLQLVIE